MAIISGNEIPEPRLFYMLRRKIAKYNSLKNGRGQITVRKVIIFVGGNDQRDVSFSVFVDCLTLLFEYPLVNRLNNIREIAVVHHLFQQRPCNATKTGVSPKAAGQTYSSDASLGFYALLYRLTFAGR